LKNPFTLKFEAVHPRVRIWIVKKNMIGRRVFALHCIAWHGKLGKENTKGKG